MRQAVHRLWVSTSNCRICLPRCFPIRLARGDTTGVSENLWCSLDIKHTLACAQLSSTNFLHPEPVTCSLSPKSCSARLVITCPEYHPPLLPQNLEYSPKFHSVPHTTAGMLNTRGSGLYRTQAVKPSEALCHLLCGRWPSGQPAKLC